jgi:branched-chain amino acid transport system substrate-binding protein
VAIAACLAALAPGCSQSLRGGGSYGPGEQARAEALFASLREGVGSGQLDAAAAAASELINSYPRFGQIDEALYLAGQVADGQGRYAQAAVYYDALSTDHPASGYRARALSAAATAYGKLDDPLREAERLLMLEALPAEARDRADTSRRLAALAQERLSPADLEALARKYPDSALARTSVLQKARSAYANGDYDRCYDLVASYLASLPREESAEDARRLMENAAERRQAPPPGPASRVDADRIGLLLPQTGSLALYGRLFEQGAKIAVDEYNERRSRHVGLVVADSRGGAVDAVKAVRRLIVEDGVIALVGDVFTLPAIAGAIEANAWRTSIVSPVVGSDDLVEIGAWVYQTRVPATIEATVLAEVATGPLALERFAILAPVRGERRAIADFFADEVRRLGHQVIAVEYFNEGAADFRPQFEKIRDATPDALFAAGSVDELLQILPQTKFFDLQVQLLGLSQWNSEKLLRLARDELEGAIFPAETHYGATPENERALREKIMEAGATDVSPVAVAGYYGTRVILDAMGAGAASRDDVRAYLEKRLRGDAAARRERAATVPLVRVRGGVLEAFTR